MSLNSVVVARLGGQRYRVAVLPSWGAAIDLWRLLDEALHADRLAVVGLNPLVRNVPSAKVWEHQDGDYLAVRDEDDPDWAKAPVIELAAIRRGRGFGRLTDAVRAVGTVRGAHGHEGGWVYRGGPPAPHVPGLNGCRITSYQGWASWWYNAGDTSSILRIDQRYHQVALPTPVVQ